MVCHRGRLILVSERYVRLYDPERQTLRQQSREAEGIYSIELQETQPGCRWNQPGEDGVEQLASDMCMSRMTFYRKIQSATGQKSTEFMRTIRLRRAAELLRQGGMTITEVSYATGFSSVSYFSRCFRTMYGVPPTQLGKTMTADDRLPSETPNRDSEVR